MPKRSRRPNILWYCTDQQRWDTINALGFHDARTPVLDRLVADGTAFLRACTQSPICTPSRASFLTGRYPASHHVHRNGVERFPTHETLVTRLFADAGYDCGMAGKLHLSAAQHTIEARCDDGYRFYEWSHHPYPDIEGNRYAEWLRNEHGLDPVELFQSITGSFGIGLPEHLHQTTWCTEMALRFLHQPRNGPWLLSLNPFAPHPTFHPPKEYLDRFDPHSLSWPLFRETDLERQRAFRAIDQQTLDAVDPRSYDPSTGPTHPSLPKDKMACIPPASYDARQLKACYLAEIALVDAQLGRILAHLDATGEIEDTLVVFMSDHGEMLGDHGLLYKGCRFFEGLVHVPLVASWPARFSHGMRSNALVELVDVAPTLLEAAGLPVPDRMQGRSLVGILEGRTDPAHHRDCVVSEYHDAMATGVRAVSGEGFDASHGTMCFDGRYKSAVYHGHEVGELFDLAADPGEFVNLWDEPAARDLKLAALKRHLDAVMATSDAGGRRTKDY